MPVDTVKARSDVVKRLVETIHEAICNTGIKVSNMEVIAACSNVINESLPLVNRSVVLVLCTPFETSQKQ